MSEIDAAKISELRELAEARLDYQSPGFAEWLEGQ